MDNKTFEQKLLQKKIEMEQCDHLFVKQKEGFWVGGFHSTDYEHTRCIVTCVKCGLTNYHFEMDPITKYNFDEFERKFNYKGYKRILLNDEIFKSQFGDKCTNRNLLDRDIFNFISEEILPTTDSISIKLYQTAKQINPDASDKELFEIMKELLPTIDPVYLYQAAKQINPDASDKELFEIEKELFEQGKVEMLKKRKGSIE